MFIPVNLFYSQRKHKDILCYLQEEKQRLLETDVLETIKRELLGLRSQALLKDTRTMSVSVLVALFLDTPDNVQGVIWPHWCCELCVSCVLGC